MGVTSRCEAEGCGAAVFCAPARSGAIATWDARRIDREDVEPVDRRKLIGLYVAGREAMRPARESDTGPFWRLHEGLCGNPERLPRARAKG